MINVRKRNGCLGLRVKALTTTGHKGALRGGGNILCLDCGNGYTSAYTCQKIPVFST